MLSCPLALACGQSSSSFFSFAWLEAEGRVVDSTCNLGREGLPRACKRHTESIWKATVHTGLTTGLAHWIKWQQGQARPDQGQARALGAPHPMFSRARVSQRGKHTRPAKCKTCQVPIRAQIRPK